MKSSHKLSLQAKMAILCSAIAAAAILLVSIFQVITVPRLLRDKASAITMGNLETVASGLNQHLNGMLSFASTFTSNTEISTALTRNNPRYTYRDSTLISTVFRLVLVSNENLIDSIVITTDKGKRYIGGNGGYLSTQVIEERFAALEKDLSISNWIIRYETAPVRNQTSMNHLQHFVSLYYILRDTVSLERIGVMYIAMNPEALLPSLDDSSRTLLLADSDGQIVIASENAEISPSLLEKLDQHTQDTSGSFLFDTSAGTTFAVFSGSAVSGWRLIETVPYDSLVGDARQFILLLSVLLLIAFASVILLTLYGTHKSLAPLKRLRDSMLAVQQGNYDVQVNVETEDEIGELARTYNLMLTRIKQLISEIVAKEQQKREIELQVLQMQINPHFLYNTLNSIHWMAIIHGLDSISNMVEALVAILRHSLQDFHELTTIREEVKTLHQYIFIQNVRFNNGITLKCQPEESLLDARIPRLLLQPLAENAVLHGIRPQGGKGTIEILIHRSDILTIDVKDSGAGFPDDIPDFIPFDALEHSLPSSGTSFSIGLKNTHERVRLRFGDAYGLLIRSPRGEGTTIRVLLPSDPQTAQASRAEESRTEITKEPPGRLSRLSQAPLSEDPH